MDCLMCATTLDAGQLIKLDCLHSHCRPCLFRNMTVSLNSMPFQPVRCCSGPIKTVVLRNLFGSKHAANLQRYRQRLAEHQTGIKLYCHDSRCHAFIPMVLRTARNGKCARCKTKTCTSCAQKWHFGQCRIPSQAPPKKPADTKEPGPEELFLSLAKRLGWKSCPQCRNSVQKNGGCNHIVCLCGCEFCYRCGKAPYADHGPCAG